MTMTDTMAPSRTSSRLTMRAQELLSINSLTVFAENPREVSPIIQGLHFSRTGVDGADLTVVATNRYVCALLELQGAAADLNSSGWLEGETLWVDQPALKQAAAMVKASKAVWATIGYDGERETAFVEVGETVFYSERSFGSYPPVIKLFPTEAPNGVETVALNVKWFVLIAKVVFPEMDRMLKERPWRFEFSHSDDNRNKPLPVLATITEGQWTIKVLIQPNLMLR